MHEVGTFVLKIAFRQILHLLCVYQVTSDGSMYRICSSMPANAKSKRK